MVLSGILTRATYGRERIYGHADVTAANGLERGPSRVAVRLSLLLKELAKGCGGWLRRVVC